MLINAWEQSPIPSAASSCSRWQGWRERERERVREKERESKVTCACVGAKANCSWRKYKETKAGQRQRQRRRVAKLPEGQIERGGGGHSIASDLDDCARNMKLSKIHELHLHFACHAPFVANVTIAATVTVAQLQQSQSQLQLHNPSWPPATPITLWTFHISRSLCELFANQTRKNLSRVSLAARCHKTLQAQVLQHATHT